MFWVELPKQSLAASTTNCVRYHQHHPSFFSHTAHGAHFPKIMLCAHSRDPGHFPFSLLGPPTCSHLPCMTASEKRHACRLDDTAEGRTIRLRGLHEAKEMKMYHTLKHEHFCRERRFVQTALHISSGTEGALAEFPGLKTNCRTAVLPFDITHKTKYY